MLLASTLSPLPAVADPSDPADDIVRSLDPALRAVVDDVLERSPELAVSRARIDALGHVPAQAGALPDPMASATAFALPPETRVGPQRLSLGARQRIPWPERRRLATERAELDVERAEAGLAAERLRLVTRVRELWAELAFLDAQAEILDDQRRHLELHEEAARARYAAGTGPASGPIRLQAETTRLQTERLAIEDRRAGLLAELSALRDRSYAEPAGDLEPSLDDPSAEDLESPLATPVAALVDRAFERRPEMTAANLGRDLATVGVAVAETSDKPDFELGVAWTFVEPREDSAGRMNPPEGNGDDVLAITAGVNLPIRRAWREAQVAEAAAREVGAGAEVRATAVSIRRKVEELAARLPIEARQLALLRDVLLVQAREAVDSAIAGYRAGSLQALDLLDAEHRLYEVRLAVARARADLAVIRARLEGALGAPLDSMRSEPSEGTLP